VYIWLYNCETRKLTERSKETLQAAEMNIIWRSLRISRKKKVRNEEIKQRMDMEGSVIDDKKTK